jgi:hypothetical protein
MAQILGLAQADLGARDEVTCPQQGTAAERERTEQQSRALAQAARCKRAHRPSSLRITGSGAPERSRP